MIKDEFEMDSKANTHFKTRTAPGGKYLKQISRLWKAFCVSSSTTRKRLLAKLTFFSKYSSKFSDKPVTKSGLSAKVGSPVTLTKDSMIMPSRVPSISIGRKGGAFRKASSDGRLNALRSTQMYDEWSVGLCRVMAIVSPSIWSTKIYDPK